MLDDALNKRIREAAEQYHPAYDESAWKKMESKLGEHMPEEKKKKRKYFLILPFLLLLGGSIFVLNSTHNSGTKNDRKNALPAMQAASNQPQDALPEKQVQALTQQTNSDAGKHNDVVLTTVSGNHETVNYLLNHSKTKDQIINGNATDARLSAQDKTSNNKVTSNQNNNAITPDNNSPDKAADESPLTSTGDNTPSTDVSKNTQNEEKSISKAADTKQKDLTKSEENTRRAKNYKSFSKNFAINISAGPDVSAVAINKIGRISLNYGLGLSYALSDKFTLRSGFYISDKIYSANKNEYTLPGGNTDYLSNINANCIVYDIPLAVSYNFSKVKNHQWFGSAGLSSYMMKKETYNYLFKYPSGYTDEKTWSISNQNRHYFSVLDLSAGYEYYFGKKTSVITEPYIKIPLAGIGAGKVKLNSGGILFTLRIKPFYK